MSRNDVYIMRDDLAAAYWKQAQGFYSLWDLSVGCELLTSFTDFYQRGAGCLAWWNNEKIMKNGLTFYVR